MMRLKSGKITILIGEEKTRIELFDYTANILFAKVELTPAQLSQALSRLGHTTCEIDVMGLKNVGKTYECKSFEFEIPGEILESEYHSDLRDQVAEYSRVACPDGWSSLAYFNSHNSFFVRDGKRWARTTIRRWI